MKEHKPSSLQESQPVVTRLVPIQAFWLKQAPRWRQPSVGYVAGLLLVVLGLIIGLPDIRLVVPLAFPGILLLCGITSIALLWGVGPAVVSTLLSVGVLDYLYIAPFAAFGFSDWGDLLQLLTFALAGGSMALLTNRLENAFHMLLRKEQEKVVQAQEAVRQRQQMLEEVNEHVGSLLATVCQELQHPLTRLKGQLRLIERKIERVGQAESFSAEALTQMIVPLSELLTQARVQVQQADSSLRGLLDVAQMQTKSFPLSRRLCDLVSIVSQIPRELRRFVPDRAIHIELPEERTIIIMGDPERLEQVITHYVLNACLYSPEQTSVTVRLVMEEQHAYVLVQDQGVGVAPEEQEQIWEPFVQIKGGKIQQESGRLGLGLAVCRYVVQQHQGQVGVQSMPGKGSTFWFSLPVLAFSYKVQVNE